MARVTVAWKQAGGFEWEVDSDSSCADTSKDNDEEDDCVILDQIDGDEIRGREVKEVWLADHAEDSELPKTDGDAGDGTAPYESIENQGHSFDALISGGGEAITPESPSEKGQMEMSADVAAVSAITPESPSEKGQIEMSADVAAVSAITLKSSSEKGQMEMSADMAVVSTITSESPSEKGQMKMSADVAVVSAITSESPLEKSQIEMSTDIVIVSAITPESPSEKGQMEMSADVAAVSVITPVSPLEKGQMEMSTDVAPFSAINSESPGQIEMSADVVAVATIASETPLGQDRKAETLSSLNAPAANYQDNDVQAGGKTISPRKRNRSLSDDENPVGSQEGNSVVTAIESSIDNDDDDDHDSDEVGEADDAAEMQSQPQPALANLSPRGCCIL